jgi:hypothetical protein
MADGLTAKHHGVMVTHGTQLAPMEAAIDETDGRQ